MDKDNISREYTKEEIIEILLDNFHDIAEVCRLSFGDDYSSENVMFVLLGNLDGEIPDLPSFELIPVVDEKECDDIGGELHSLFLQKDEKLNELLAGGIIDKPTYDFIIKMKELAATCNRDMIIPEVLKIIDSGITGYDVNYNKYKLKPLTNEEDIEYEIEQGDNYYPIDAPDISGQLANTYYTLYPNEIIQEKYHL